MTTHTPTSLTSDEVAALQAVREGRQPQASAHTASLIDKGYLTQNGDTLRIGQHEDEHLNVLPNYGEALVDILIPGAGTDEAARRDLHGDDAAPKSKQIEP